MVIKDNIRMAYSEVDEFIELLPEDIKQKIPQNLRRIFKEEKDKNYVKKIAQNIPIKKQNLLEETLAIIAMLNLDYICEDEDEKERLREVYENNEKKYQKLFQMDFNDNEIFGKIDYNKKQEKNIVIIKKQTMFQKLVSKVKSIFNKKVK